jgi:hypothetical protein
MACVARSWANFSTADLARLSPSLARWWFVERKLLTRRNLFVGVQAAQFLSRGHGRVLHGPRDLIDYTGQPAPLGRATGLPAGGIGLTLMHLHRLHDVRGWLSAATALGTSRLLRICIHANGLQQRFDQHRRAHGRADRCLDVDIDAATVEKVVLGNIRCHVTTHMQDTGRWYVRVKK